MKHLAKHKLRNGMDVRCGQHRCTKCGKQFAHAAVLASHARIVHPGHLYSWFLLLFITSFHRLLFA